MGTWDVAKASGVWHKSVKFFRLSGDTEDKGKDSRDSATSKELNLRDKLLIRGREFLSKAKKVLEKDETEATSADLIVLSDSNLTKILDVYKVGAPLFPPLGAIGGIMLVASSLPELIQSAKEKREENALKKLEALSNIGWGMQVLSSTSRLVLNSVILTTLSKAFGVLGAHLQIAAGVLKLRKAKNFKMIRDRTLKEGALDLVAGSAWLLGTLGINPVLSAAVFAGATIAKELITHKGLVGALKEKVIDKTLRKLSNKEVKARS